MEFEDAAIGQDRLLAGILLEQVGLVSTILSPLYWLLTALLVFRDLCILVRRSYLRPNSAGSIPVVIHGTGR